MKANFRGQHPWRIRERLIAEAINKTLALEANFICNAKFEQVSHQWKAMYGTAVQEYDWKENTTTDGNHNQSTVPQLPDYDDQNSSDGSGSLTNTTEQVQTSYDDQNISEGSGGLTSTTEEVETIDNDQSISDESGSLTNTTEQVQTTNSNI